VDWQIAAVLALRDARTPVVDALMWLPNVAGSPAFYAVALPLVFMTLGKARGYRFVAVMGVTFALMATLKAVFGHPRPFVTLQFDPLYSHVGHLSASFPSGHAMGTAGFWLLLAFELRRRWLFFFAVAFASFVSFSRIYAGVHWPEDVLFGALIGWLIAWLSARGLGDAAPDSRLLRRIAAAGLVITAGLCVVNTAALPFLGLVLGMTPCLLVDHPTPELRDKSFWLTYVLPAAVMMAVIMLAARTILPPSSLSRAVGYGSASLWLAWPAPILAARARRWLSGV